jgi:hypothetical protein
MPRKRRVFVTTVEPPQPKLDPKAATLEALVGATLNDFDEFSPLPAPSKDQLIKDLVESIRRARAGLRFRRRGVGDEYQVKAVYLSDLARALEAAGVPVTRWRKVYDGGEKEDESLFFRVARALSGDAGLKLPADLKELGQASTSWKKSA